MTQIDDLLAALRADRHLWAQAPCGHEYALNESELFHGDKLPKAAKAYAAGEKEYAKGIQVAIDRQRHAFTAGFTQRSVDVKWGKTVEKICTVMPGFPYEPGDCRPLGDPIDYVIFEGSTEGTVRAVTFADVKTGSAQLTNVQREVRDAVQDGRVSVRKVQQ
jgi:predicted Holliday junction resolvase-like endonuclease